MATSGLNAGQGRDPTSTYQSLSLYSYIVSYDMHGFHRGSPALQELLEHNSTPDMCVTTVRIVCT